MAGVNIGSLPFKEQIAFFRKKASVGTRAWTDLWQEQHDHSFVVAGAMKGDLLADLRTAVDGVIADGTTLEQFRQGFDEIVAKHGWEYKGGRNWRTRVIYDTNLRASYQAGRYAQLKDPDLLQLRPYWMYKHSDLVVDPRPEHLAWDGLVLPHDDPWWNTHYPPNGWGCMCSVRPVGERQLKQMGKDGPDTAPPIEYETKTVGARGPTPRTVQTPQGIDPGWAYAPGKSALEHAREVAAMRLDSLPLDIGAQVGASLPLFGDHVLPAYQRWLDDLDRASPQNQSMILGAIKPKVAKIIADDFSTDLQTASITAIDKQISHLMRDAKAAATTSTGLPKALSIEEINRLPIIVDQYDAVLWDNEDPAILFIKSALMDEREFAKAVVRVNFLTRTVADKQVITNSIRSGGYVNRENLTAPRYTLLDGSL